MRKAHCGKGVISAFQKFFASINKICILVRIVGTRLLFYKVLRVSFFLFFFYGLSPLAIYIRTIFIGDTMPYFFLIYTGCL